MASDPRALVAEARTFALDAAHNPAYCTYCIAGRDNLESACPIDEGAAIASRLADALAAAVEDGERLDWLGAQIVEVNREVFAHGLRYVRGDMSSDADNAALIRAAIDAARKGDRDGDAE